MWDKRLIKLNKKLRNVFKIKKKNFLKYEESQKSEQWIWFFAEWSNHSNISARHRSRTFGLTISRRKYYFGIFENNLLSNIFFSYSEIFSLHKWSFQNSTMVASIGKEIRKCSIILLTRALPLFDNKNIQILPKNFLNVLRKLERMTLKNCDRLEICLAWRIVAYIG